MRSWLTGPRLVRFLIADSVLVALFIALGIARGFTTSLIVIFVVAEVLVTATLLIAIAIALAPSPPEREDRGDDLDAG